MSRAARCYDIPALLARGEAAGCPSIHGILFTGTAPVASQKMEAQYLEWLIRERLAFSVSTVQIPFIVGSLMPRRNKESEMHLAYKASAVEWLTANCYQDIEVEGYSVYGEADVSSRELTVECGQCPPERILKVLARGGSPILVLPYGHRDGMITGYLFKPMAHALIGAWAESGALPLEGFYV